MIFTLLLALTGLTLSAVAIYYSVLGLTAIFAAAFWPIVTMGATLEISKLVAASWLKANWHRIPLFMKAYMMTAVIVLMLITSMGVFGFLSKAHLDQAVPSGDVSAKLQIIDDKITAEKDTITSNKRALTQLDAQVDQMLNRTTDDRGANRAVQIRRQQAKERTLLQKEISQAQTRITKLNDERAPIAGELRKIEAEVGPIKYIAAMMYGDNIDSTLLEKAVTWVITIIVLVFDPLAVLMLLGSQMTWQWYREDKHSNAIHEESSTFTNDNKSDQVPDSELWPSYELDDGPLTDAQIDEINRMANVQVKPTETLFDSEEEFFEHGKELAREIDANDGKLPTKDFSADEFLESIEDAPANESTLKVEEFDISKHAYLQNEWKWFSRSDNDNIIPTHTVNISEVLGVDNPITETQLDTITADTDTEEPLLDDAAIEALKWAEEQRELAVEESKKKTVTWMEQEGNHQVKKSREI